MGTCQGEERHTVPHPVAAVAEAVAAWIWFGSNFVEFLFFVLVCN